MNEQTLLYAMGDINDSYILSAQKKITHPPINRTRVTRRHTSRRASWWLVAAILTLLATLTMAMASNENLRTAVFTFLGIEKTEVVPEHDVMSSALPEVDPIKSDIGGMIEGTYIHTPVASHAVAGVFLICTDEVETKQGSHYDAYREENGKLIKLESHSFRENILIEGHEFHTDFEWVDIDGRTVVTYCEPSAQYRILDFSGSPESTLITFYIFDRETWEMTEYLALVNLTTGTFSIVFTGMDISNVAISDDQTKMLLSTNDSSLYYVDLASKEILNVDVLSGEHTWNCSLIGNTLACWTLDGADVESAALGEFHAWTIDLSTMECRDIFRDIPATAATSYDVWSATYAIEQHAPEVWAQTGTGELPPLNRSGIQFIAGFGNIFYSSSMFLGSRFAVDVQEDRSVYTIDLLNGERTKIDGFLWPDADYPEIQWVPSPDGKKLMIYGADSTNVKNTFSYIGVLDFDRKCFIQFSRENMNDISEHRVYWFDNDRIVVRANGDDASTDFYVYCLIQ